MKIENLEHVQTLCISAADRWESLSNTKGETIESETIRGGQWLGYRGRFGSAASAAATAIALGKNTYTLASSFARTSQYGSVASSSSYARSSP